MNRESALEWANQHLSDVRDCTKVTDTPWAKTYKVTHAQGRAWLKILPEPNTAAPATVALLGSRFSGTVPAALASDISRGLVLLADNDGKNCARKLPEAARTQLLQTYATIQSQCVDYEELLTTASQVNQHNIVSNLLAFFEPGSDLTNLPGAKVHADYFLSTRRCQMYASLLSSRASQLNDYILENNELPTTINHCDLRPKNAAIDSEGKTILYHWDEAQVGPAGMSLHAMFSGCSRILHVLGDQAGFIDAETLRQPRRELRAYIQRLADSGYADKNDLNQCISASAVSGMLHFITSYSCFPRDKDSYKKTVREMLIKRLSDVLDVCDYLSITDAKRTLVSVKSYAKHNRSTRAEQLLGRHLQYIPDNADAHYQLGKLQLNNGQPAKAIGSYEQALQIDPQMHRCRTQLAQAYTQTGQFDEAKRHLRQVMLKQKTRKTTEYLNRVHTLARESAQSDEAGAMPTVSFSAKEKETGRASLDTTLQCKRLFARHGTLLLKDVFDKALLTQCHDAFLERYAAYLTNARHTDALRIGDKRFQTTIDMEAPFNDPNIFANELIQPLMRELLSDKHILGCFTSSLSLPGSEDQRLHKDHKLLIPNAGDAGHKCFAVTMMLPLIPVDETVGTTRVKKGSHLVSTTDAKLMPYQTPLTTLGDCYLMDYRLSHHGQANQSQTPRPILNMVYHRPWFRDYINFGKQPALRITQSAFDALPDRCKPLLKWTNEPSPR